METFRGDNQTFRFQDFLIEKTKELTKASQTLDIVTERYDNYYPKHRSDACNDCTTSKLVLLPRN